MDARETRLPSLIQALLDPIAYPQPTSAVSLIQTHVSYILLTDDFTYKVKKPLNLGFLDFSSLERRSYFCQREVALNRRLCQDLYLGVVPVVEQSGRIVVGGAGEPIEWAVKMRRLPEDRLLTSLLASGTVESDDLVRVAHRLASFYGAAATGPGIDSYGEPDQIQVNTDENFAQLRPFLGKTMKTAQYDVIRRFTESFLRERGDLFAQRIVGHRIRDCHGDLHAGSICFGDDLYIFDCIEFNDRFRYQDALADVAFLAMDLERYGRADLAWHFVNAYRRAAADNAPDGLLGFYKCYRAMVRAKVESYKLNESDFRADEKSSAIAAARGYVDLAFTYAGGMPRPILLATGGLMGSGKTTLAREIAQHFAVVHLSSDMTRKRLAGLGPTEHRLEDFGQGLYSEEFTDNTYAALCDEAEEWLGRGVSVIVDATFSTRRERDRLRDVADRARVPLLLIECVASDDVIRARLARRAHHPGEASDGRLEIFERHRRAFQPFAELPDEQHLTVETTTNPDSLVEVIRQRLMGLS